MLRSGAEPDGENLRSGAEPDNRRDSKVDDGAAFLTGASVDKRL